MIKNWRIIVVTPAGRKKYLSILASYILSENLIDEWQLWVNTTNIDDINFMEELKRKYSKIKLIYSKNKIQGNLSIGQFFKYTVDPSSIYIRVDDDVVFFEENFFKKLVYERINNRNPLLIFPVIINNSIISHLLQQNKIINLNY